MNSASHLLIGATGALLLIFLGHSPEAALIMVCWSVLIDLDHVIYFLIADKAFTVREQLACARSYHAKMQANLYAFHSPEFLVALIIASIAWPILWAVVLATVVHTLMDLMEHHHAHSNYAWYPRWSIIAAIRR